MGPLWVPSRRFGVKQGSKVRPVDDFSEFLINEAVSVTEKIDLGGLDELVATAREWAAAVSDDRRIEVRADSGEVLSGILHPEWSVADARRLRGRTLDLKAAYKQLAVRPSQASFAVLSVWDPGARTHRLFVSRALPFGAVASVHAFNRAARALHRLLGRLLNLVVTNYFDDYPQLELARLADCSQGAAEQLLQLLGWQVALEEKKRLPFAESFPVLGVSVGLPQARGEPVRAANKADRVEALSADLTRALAEGLSASEAATLRGRLQFALAQTFARVGAPALAVLGAREMLGRPGERPRPALGEALWWLLRFVNEAPPRAIPTSREGAPALVFTDGACEAGGASSGAALFERPGCPPSFFRMRDPPEVIAEWAAGGEPHAIAQAELLPVLVARLTWADRLRNRFVVYYIDNESVREALVRGWTGALASRALLLQCAWADVALSAVSWYARVPSPSNPADGPSRLEDPAMPEWPDAVEDVPVPPSGWGGEPGKMGKKGGGLGQLPSIGSSSPLWGGWGRGPSAAG